MGFLACEESKGSEALIIAEHSIELWKELAEDLGGLAYTKLVYAIALEYTGQLPQSRTIIAESVDLFRRSGDEANLDTALYWQGLLAFADKDLEFAKATALEALSLAQSIGDIVGIACATNTLGIVATSQFDYGAALSFFESSLAHFREVGDLSGMSMALKFLSHLSLNQANYAPAKNYLDESLQIGRKVGNKSTIAGSLYTLGLRAFQMNRLEQAHHYYAEALHSCAVMTPLDQASLVHCLTALSLLLVSEREAMQGAQILGVVAHLLEDEAIFLPIFESIHEQSLAKAKLLLSEETLASQIAIGRSMEYDQAIDYALRVNSEASSTAAGQLSP